MLKWLNKNMKYFWKNENIFSATILLVYGPSHVVHHWETANGFQEVIIRAVGRKLKMEIRNFLFFSQQKICYTDSELRNIYYVKYPEKAFEETKKLIPTKGVVFCFFSLSLLLFICAVCFSSQNLHFQF